MKHLTPVNVSHKNSISDSEPIKRQQLKKYQIKRNIFEDVFGTSSRRDEPVSFCQNFQNSTNSVNGKSSLCEKNNSPRNKKTTFYKVIPRGVYHKSNSIRRTQDDLVRKKAFHEPPVSLWTHRQIQRSASLHVEPYFQRQRNYKNPLVCNWDNSNEIQKMKYGNSHSNHRNNLVETKLTVNSTRQETRENSNPNDPSFSGKISSISAQRYGVGIAGFDRLTSPFYRFSLKLLWGFSFCLLFVICCYFSGCCLYEYAFGKPAIVVEFRKFNSIPNPPKAVICPLSLMNKNLVTDRIRKTYSEHFKIEEKEVNALPFSEMLRLPKMNMTTIWNMYEIDKDNVQFLWKCSASKSDKGCLENVKTNELPTAAGRCITIELGAIKDFTGPLGTMKILVKPPEKAWFGTDFYIRGNFVPSEENSLFQQPSIGMPGPLGVDTKCIGEITELHNMNLRNAPCEDSLQIEQCIENCLKTKLYSQVPCRLPFMMNFSLEDCTTPELFNTSWEISKRVMNSKDHCRAQCPRKCTEVLYFLSCQLNKYVKEMTFSSTIQYLDTIATIVQERYWYSFFNLVADIGGSLGVFLDINLLTFVEIVEIVIELIYIKLFFSRKKRNSQISLQKPNEVSSGSFWSNRISRRNKHSIKPMEHSNLDSKLPPPNIGIIGCDRIFGRCSIYRKVPWFLAILCCLFVSYIQIRDSIRNFRDADPDVKLTIEKNETIKYPTLSMCPFRPFQHWIYFHELREKYQTHFNHTGNLDDLLLSDLLTVPEVNISEIWESYSGINKQQVSNVDVDCRGIIKSPPNDDVFNVTVTEHNVINGKCLSINIAPESKHHGTGTMTCFVFQYLPKTKTSRYPVQFYIHEEFDDVRTFDPHLGIPVALGTTGISSLHFRKRKLMNLRKRPCENPSDAAKCKSECFDVLMEKGNISCRLPFMKHNNLGLCATPEQFNHTMETAYSILNGNNDNWCNCPPKCEEYFHTLNLNTFVFQKGLEFIFLGIQMPNNYIRVTSEYSQATIASIFGNICGILGLYLGFCLLTILEIIETIILLILKARMYRKRK